MADIRFCPNCGPRELDIRGRCSGCGSDQTVPDHRPEPNQEEINKALERITKNEQQRANR